jgi:hypothetical protein
MRIRLTRCHEGERKSRPGLVSNHSHRVRTISECTPITPERPARGADQVTITFLVIQAPMKHTEVAARLSEDSTILHAAYGETPAHDVTHAGTCACTALTQACSWRHTEKLSISNSSSFRRFQASKSNTNPRSKDILLNHLCFLEVKAI